MAFSHAGESCCGERRDCFSTAVADWRSFLRKGEAVCGDASGAGRGTSLWPRPAGVEASRSGAVEKLRGSRAVARRRVALIAAMVFGLSERRTGSIVSTRWMSRRLIRYGDTFDVSQWVV